MRITPSGRSARIPLWLAVTAALVPATLAASTPAQAVSGQTVTDPAYLPVAKVYVGAAGASGSKGCTGVLVAPQWIATAKDCFPGVVSAGPVPVATTVTVGRLDLTSTAGSTTTVTDLVPRADRDVVLARLKTPVTGITPAVIDTSVPSTGAALRVAGFGRTKTEWVPDTLHADTFSVRGVTATTLDILGTDPKAASTCPGDAGGPSFRELSGGGLAAVALHSRSQRGGCYGVDSTAQGSTDVRLDDIADWVAQHTATQPKDGYKFATGDLTGDAIDDLTYVDANTGKLWLFPGTDTTRFGVPIELGGGWNAMTDVVEGDFNWDGKDDILAVQSSSPKLWLYPGGGNGRLGARVQFRSSWPAGTTELAAGDFVGDAHDELFAIDGTTGKLWLYSSSSAGIGAGVVIGNGGWNTMESLATGDFNHDGRTDLVALGPLNHQGTKDVWSYPGTGVSGAKTLGVRIHLTAAAIVQNEIGGGKFDEDNLADLLMGAANLLPLSLSPGRSDGTLGPWVMVE